MLDRSHARRSRGAVAGGRGRLVIILLALAITGQLLGGLGLLRAAEEPAWGPPFDVREVRAELALIEERRTAAPPALSSPEHDDDAPWIAELDVASGADEPASSSEPDESDASFGADFPAHEQAHQRDGEPDTFHWAVLVGVNEYQRAGDTFGSVPDAELLRGLLHDRGWREDHVLVLTDSMATRERIVQALEWLARKTDERSTVVFSMSGHIRHRAGVSALWPTDSGFIWAEELGRLLAPIEADKMWLSFQGCHAQGLSAPGVEGDNRVVTYSSRTHEKSFEDPETGHSLQGYYLFAEGLRDGWGDRADSGNGDGQVSVQEAFRWGAPRATIRSANQQHPVIVDGLGRPFHLEVESTVPALP